MSSGGKYVAAVSQCGDGKAKDGLGRRKEEEADDVVAHCRSELSGGRAVRNQRTDRSTPHPPPSMVQILCALTAALLPAQSRTSRQQISRSLLGCTAGSHLVYILCRMISANVRMPMTF